eukprot:Skav212140  [mRNA]  locus=scaffold1323:273172:275378:- [translate_table: standard]
MILTVVAPPGLTTGKSQSSRGGLELLTNFYASTEEGELILGDWAARGEEDAVQ